MFSGLRSKSGEACVGGGGARCGKTANAISGTLDWAGPAILSSVKADLMSATLTQRRRLGDVRVFDPTNATDQPSAGWSPLGIIIVLLLILWLTGNLN